MRLDDVGDVLGEVLFDLALLARLHVGGERLAAFLDHARDVAGERLDIDGAGPVSAGSDTGFSMASPRAQEVARPRRQASWQAFRGFSVRTRVRSGLASILAAIAES